ncbi:MAG: hypothetical protein WC107_02570 [Patescibacteria group bacterium]
MGVSRYLKGFLALEFLLSAAIICVLLGITFIGVDNSLRSRRDTIRRDNLHALKIAIDISFGVDIDGVKKAGSYYAAETPVEVSSLTWLAPAYIPTIPPDPKKNGYLYQTDSEGKVFAVYAKLEDNSNTDLKSSGPFPEWKLPDGFNYWLKNN